MRRKPNFYLLKMVKIPKKGFKKYKINVLQKITLIIRIRIQDPDPDPDPKKSENAGSGSGSVYNVYGSETLVYCGFLWLTFIGKMISVW